MIRDARALIKLKQRPVPFQVWLIFNDVIYGGAALRSALRLTRRWAATELWLTDASGRIHRPEKAN